MMPKASLRTITTFTRCSGSSSARWRDSTTGQTVPGVLAGRLQEVLKQCGAAPSHWNDCSSPLSTTDQAAARTAYADSDWCGGKLKLSPTTCCTLLFLHIEAVRAGTFQTPGSAAINMSQFSHICFLISASEMKSNGFRLKFHRTLFKGLQHVI